MPLYSYINDDTREIREIVQSMKEEHVYVDENGLKWRRLWNLPETAENIKIDPFDQQAYIDKTGGNSKGNIGSLWDRSADLSDQRAAKNGGVDPVKEAHYEKYARDRNGSLHPRQIKEKMKDFILKL